ncbi:SRPBCC family protein [Cohnella silvisoli]|uniref:SRPBCC domain-containing protein n=1 Tax=Cohnella silvisoli TaxID=2873699 RepID=A0ABV1KUN9_9BACL|nr:SRPBCC domain-containing protein [Cohnella silvisoli]MCD9023124.1 SRPBCC domain-containing protein [Cohnella silvisoli]
MITMQNGKFTLELNHTYNTRKENVFQAWTNPEQLKQWWGPEGFTTTIDQMDVKAGGHYRFIMHSPNGKDHVIAGIYKEIISNEKLVFTWKWENNGSELEETLVTIEFHERNSKTELVITHENFSTREEAEEHNKGWSSSLEGSLLKYFG